MSRSDDFLWYPPLGPPGHIPGVHVPGTLTPIAAVIASQQQAENEQVQAAQQAQEAQRLRRKRRAHLALHRR